jgi:hypothetical protein
VSEIKKGEKNKTDLIQLKPQYDPGYQSYSRWYSTWKKIGICSKKFGVSEKFGETFNWIGEGTTYYWPT